MASHNRSTKQDPLPKPDDAAGEAANVRGSSDPLPPPLVAAYEAGRLANRALWAMQQAWLAGSRPHFEQAREALGALAVMARNAATPDARDRMQAAVTGILREWELSYDSIERREELVGTNLDLNARAERVDDFLRLREWVCTSVLAPVFALLDRTRRTVRDGLSDRQQAAWGLGEAVDQGLHPADVYRCMYQPMPSRSTSLGMSHWAYIDENARRAPVPHQNYLAGRGTFKPGELPPHTFWSEDLRQRWAAVGFRAEALDPLFEPAPLVYGHDPDGEAARAGQVGQIDQ